MGILIKLLYIQMIGSAFFTIITNNTIYAVLYLILTFCIASIIFIVTGAPFIGLVFLMVYVGAIAVLFLFVVMMLNIPKPIKEPKSFLIYLGILLLGVVYCYGPYLDNYLLMPEQDPLYNFCINYSEVNFGIGFDYPVLKYSGNPDQIHAIANFIFKKSIISFIYSGVLLLLAMVGAIILTLEDDKPAKTQNLVKQISTDYAQSVVEKRISI